MAIDYMILYPCEVRKQITDDALLRLIKARKNVKTIMADVRKNQPDIAPEKLLAFTVHHTQRGPDGHTVETQTSVGELNAQTAPLDELGVFCKNCPARIKNTSFGCTGTVKYPIKGAVEEWLLARLPEDRKAPSLKMLLSLMAEMGIDGATVDAQRARNRAYERSTPVFRKWGGWLTRKTVSSSQLLQLLLTMGEMEPDALLVVAKLLRFPEVPPFKKPDKTPTPKDSLDPIKAYMMAALVAAKTKSRLLVDA